MISFFTVHSLTLFLFRSSNTQRLTNNKITVANLGDGAQRKAILTQLGPSVTKTKGVIRCKWRHTFPSLYRAIASAGDRIYSLKKQHCTSPSLDGEYHITQLRTQLSTLTTFSIQWTILTWNSANSHSNTYCTVFATHTLTNVTFITMSKNVVAGTQINERQ